MSVNYPSLSKGVQSIFIDLLFMIALMFLAGWVLDKINPSDEGQDGLIRAILFVSIWGIYEPVAMTFGCTVGNLLTKITVRQFGSIEEKSIFTRRTSGL